MYEKRFVEVGEPGGVGPTRIAYVDAGPREASETLLFVHGIPTSSYLWRDVLGALDDEYRCIAPDLLGLGDTIGSLDADYSMGAHARRCFALADALGVSTVTLVAHDQGGAAAQQMIALAPERLRRVVLANVVCFDNWPVPVIRRLMAVARREWLWRLLGATHLMDVFSVSPWGMYRGVKRRRNLEIATLMELGRPQREPEGRERFRRFLLAGDSVSTTAVIPALRRFEAPVQVIWALDDAFLPLADGCRLAALFPNARPVETIADAGHFLQEERPEELARLIRAFVGSTV